MERDDDDDPFIGLPSTELMLKDDGGGIGKSSEKTQLLLKSNALLHKGNSR